MEGRAALIPAGRARRFRPRASFADPPATRAVPKKRRKKSAPPAPDAPDGLAGRALDLWRAGLGALAAGKRLGLPFDALVARGAEAVEGEVAAVDAGALDAAAGRLRTSDLPLSHGTGASPPRTRKAALEASIAEALVRFDVAGRSDVDRLRADLRALDARLARLVDAPPPPETTFRVAPHAEGWAVSCDGAALPRVVVETKKRALLEGRRLARTTPPSRLVVCNRDGAEVELGAYPA